MAVGGRQSGVALAVVLWFLAGMSLLVSGIVFQARTDTRMAQLHLARATAVAAGDGAMLVALAKLVASDPETRRETGLQREEVSIGPHVVSVQLVPVAGLVNINQAPAELLARLFAAQGQVSEAEAKTMAQNVIKWRAVAGPDGSRRSARQFKSVRRFQSVEDLLQVEGFTRTVWDALRDSIATDDDAAGTLDSSVDRAPGQAPVGGDQGPRELSGSSFRVDAVLEVGGRSWLRRKWVSLDGGPAGGVVPWVFNRVEAPRVLPVD